MPNILRLKRRESGAAGAPSALKQSEPAYNEVDDTLYLGVGSGGGGGNAASIKAVAGAGAFVSKTGNQTISGDKVFTGLVDLSGATIPSLSLSQNLTVVGNLIVQGTTTTVSSTTITVADKNLELGKVSSPSDTTADGGGLTLLGDNPHTFNWVNNTDSWTSSEHIELAQNKKFRIDNVDVLTKTGLGSTVLASSLTSVGTITSGVWNASDIGVAHGGTGASNASQARTNLGLAIGSDVQAFDADLAALAGVASAANKIAYFTGAAQADVADFTPYARTLLDDGDAATARGTLGLGSMATQNNTAVNIDGGTIDGITLDGGTF